MNSFIEALKWRYAVKRFSHQTVSDDKIQTVLEAARLAASSYGLQPYRFVLVQNSSLRSQLPEISYGQTKVEQASHLVVLATLKNIDDDLVRQHVNRLKSDSGMPLSIVEKLEQDMLNFVQSRETDWLLDWAKRQTYIALGFLLTACATEAVDACPMEGFQPEAYDKVLGLSRLSLSATVVVPMGYRAPEDAYAGYKKVRPPADTMIVTL